VCRQNRSCVILSLRFTTRFKLIYHRQLLMLCAGTGQAFKCLFLIYNLASVNVLIFNAVGSYGMLPGALVNGEMR